jgi:hypothetical protein
MKTTIRHYAIIVPLLFSSGLDGLAQGFVNLDFESANPSGYSPGANNLPTSSAFPEWGVYYSSPGVGTNAPTRVWYDSLSLGGAFISVNDVNTGSGFAPIQGQYSAYLFGGPSDYFSIDGNPTYVTLSQTGLVPNGTESLEMDVRAGNGFTVTLGGQAINMVPLETFPGYTTYGGDISGLAGSIAQLSVTAPPTGVPNAVLLDNIRFSSQFVPEPGVFSLSALGALLLGWHGLGRRR